MKGESSSLLCDAWWKESVRMAKFSQVLAQGERGIATPDGFKRTYCGRAPIEGIKTAHTALAYRDLYIVSNVLFMPLDCAGQTLGYAMIDVGRADIITNLLDLIPKEPFNLKTDFCQKKIEILIAKVENVCGIPDCSFNDSNGIHSNDGADPSKDVWACSACTLENLLDGVECVACGSPIPPEMASLVQTSSKMQGRKLI